jgi:hypothetical protein
MPLQHGGAIGPDQGLPGDRQCWLRSERVQLGSPAPPHAVVLIAAVGRGRRELRLTTTNTRTMKASRMGSMVV